MNKNELITFLRNPNDLTESDLAELEQIVDSNPYFLSGRLLLAKGSKELKHPETRKRISSAAVYSTDRPFLKKYLSGKLFFLSKPPEEEEIVEEKTPTSKEASEEEKKEQKIQIISSPKKQEGENSVGKKESKVPASDKDKPRREPRFDPSATASFRRRWDVKSDSTSEPKSSENAPTKKPVFVGKKVDRSNRVRKKSIREELLNESKPVTKKDNPKPASPAKPVQQEKESKPSFPQGKESPDTEKPLKATETIKKKAVSDELQKPAERPRPAQPIVKEAASQENKTVMPTAKKIEPKPEEKKDKPSISKVSSKPSLKIPEVPNGGLDALLEELQRDMEILKSSRTKFTEVQQKIEEDDAVSAALERATKKHPETKPETIASNPDVEEKKEIVEDPAKESSTEPNSSIESSNEGVDAKKVGKEKTTKKKEESKATSKKGAALKAEKKTTSSKSKPKKATPKKVTAAKKQPAKKVASKSAAKKVKSPSKESQEEKKDRAVSETAKPDQNTIIDKFIAETPSIKYQKKSESTTNEDLSDQSTGWNKELASEYLAEIYLHQGNKKRAIEIYRALSLKFPEKKSYFADLISKTK